MPKSKRAKKVSLTKTSSKGKELKKELVDKVRDALDEYSHVYVLNYTNMRATHFKDVRADWKDSRFFLGKNKVMCLALGNKVEDEYKEGLSNLSQYISSNCALLCTNTGLDETVEYFTNLSHKDYARSGFKSHSLISIPAGELKDKPHSMLEELRKLGMPVDLNRGVIVLRKDYVVCRVGQILTPEQCRILKHFDKPMAEFKLSVRAMYTGGEVTSYGEEQVEGGDEEVHQEDGEEVGGEEMEEDDE